MNSEVKYGTTSQPTMQQLKRMRKFSLLLVQCPQCCEKALNTIPLLLKHDHPCSYVYVGVSECVCFTHKENHPEGHIVYSYL